MNAQQLLESLNLLDENERIEAKRANEVGKSLMETVCAFSNEPSLGGGWLLLGVAREDLALFPSYEVHGLEQPDKVCSDLATQSATMFNRPLRLEIQTEVLNGKAVVVVFVPEAPAQDKPIYLKAQGLPSGAFRRIGSTDQRCTEDDLVALYQGRNHQSFDSGGVWGATLDDFSPEAINDYRQSRREANPDAEELRWTDQELLQALGCVAAGEKGELLPTVAGLILFAKPSALRRTFPTTRVDYIRVPGREWLPDPERRFDSLEMRDPLFRLLRRVQAAILDDLPKAFGLAEGDLQRKDSPIVPQRVIREAIVNALMHRSYRSHAPVQIIRYSNRLEIRNPGFSLKSPEHLGEPGSLPRNPKVAAALYDTRFAETKGSGVRVMREVCEMAGLAPPLFESDRGSDQFVVRLFFHHFLGPDDLSWLAQFKELHLSEAEARALVVTREAGAIDNSTWRDINKVDALIASQGLKKLRDAGLLEQKGRGSATWYKPTTRMLGTDAQAPSDRPAGEPGSLSRELAPLPRDPDSLDSDTAAARQALLAELPGHIGERIGSLGRRSPPDAVRLVLLELLSHRDFRLEELGALLKRNPEYVRQRYVQPMLLDGSITMTKPDKPNDPEQAYRISS